VAEFTLAVLMAMAESAAVGMALPPEGGLL